MFAAVWLKGDGEIDNAELQRHLEVRADLQPLFVPLATLPIGNANSDGKDREPPVHQLLTVGFCRLQVLASEKQGRKLGRSPSRDYESKRAAGINPEADSP